MGSGFSTFEEALRYIKKAYQPAVTWIEVKL